MEYGSEDLSTSELGRLLVDGHRQLDQKESEWLAWLAEFDQRSGWALDGAINCVSWLVQQCDMAYPTAKDKLRVALELERRPVLAAALAVGELSYCKVRALTRITGGDDAADERFVADVKHRTVDDAEALVRHHKLLEEQDKPPDFRFERRGVRITRRYDGMATVETVVPVEDAERLIKILDLLVMRTEENRVEPVDSCESPQPGDSCESADPLARATCQQRRADELLDLI